MSRNVVRTASAAHSWSCILCVVFRKLCRNSQLFSQCPTPADSRWSQRGKCSVRYAKRTCVVCIAYPFRTMSPICWVSPGRMTFCPIYWCHQAFRRNRTLSKTGTSSSFQAFSASKSVSFKNQPKLDWSPQPLRVSGPWCHFEQGTWCHCQWVS